MPRPLEEEDPRLAQRQFDQRFGRLGPCSRNDQDRRDCKSALGRGDDGESGIIDTTSLETPS